MKEIPIEYETSLSPHYSAAVVHDGLVYVSGQLAIDNASGKVVDGGVEEHTLQALRNLQRVLERSGTDISHVLQCRIYTSGVENWGKINQVYREFFGEHRPARTIVPTRELHLGSLVEIEATAYL